jgi:hypothetical protein
MSFFVEVQMYEDAKCMKMYEDAKMYKVLFCRRTYELIVNIVENVKNLFQKLG